jgi:hypothetical protein
VSAAGAADAAASSETAAASPEAPDAPAGLSSAHEARNRILRRIPRGSGFRDERIGNMV